MGTINFTTLPDEESLLIPSMYRGDGFISQGLFNISNKGLMHTFSIKNGEAYSPVLNKGFLESINKIVDKDKLAGLNGGQTYTTQRLELLNKQLELTRSSKRNMMEEVRKYSTARREVTKYNAENSMLMSAAKGYGNIDLANTILRSESVMNTSGMDEFITRYTKTALKINSLTKKLEDASLSQEEKTKTLGQIFSLSHEEKHLKPTEDLVTFGRVSSMPKGASNSANEEIKQQISRAIQQKINLGHSDEEILSDLIADTDFKGSLGDIAISKLNISSFEPTDVGDDIYKFALKQKVFDPSTVDDGNVIHQLVSEFEQKVSKNAGRVVEQEHELNRLEGRIKREKETLMASSATMPKEQLDAELANIDNKYADRVEPLRKAVSTHKKMESAVKDINAGTPSDSTIEFISNIIQARHENKIENEIRSIQNQQRNEGVDQAYAELESAINKAMADNDPNTPIYATFANGSEASSAMLEIEDKNARSLYSAIYQETADGSYSNSGFLTTLPVQDDDGRITRIAINDLDDFDKSMAFDYLTEISSSDVIGNEHIYLNHTSNGEKVSTPIDFIYRKAMDYRTRVNKLDEQGRAILYADAAREYSKAPIDIRATGDVVANIDPAKAPHGRSIQLTDREIALLGGEETAKKLSDRVSILTPTEKAFGDSRYTPPKVIGENVRFLDNVLDPILTGDNDVLKQKAVDLQARFVSIARLEKNIQEGNYARIGASIDAAADGTYARIYKGILQHSDLALDTKFSSLPKELQVEMAEKMRAAMTRDIDYGISNLVTTAYNQKFDPEKLEIKKLLLEHEKMFFEAQVEYSNMYERGTTMKDSSDASRIGTLNDSDAAKEIRRIDRELEKTAEAIRAQGISVSEADRKIVDRIGKKDFEGLKLIVGDAYETLNVKKLGRGLSLEELSTGIVNYNDSDMAIENFDAYYQLMSIDEIRGKVGDLSFTNEEWNSGYVNFGENKFKISQFYEYYNLDKRIAQEEYSEVVRKQGLKSIADVNASLQQAVANAMEDVEYLGRKTVRGELVEKTKLVGKENSLVPKDLVIRGSEKENAFKYYFSSFELENNIVIDETGTGNYVLSFPEAPKGGFTEKIIKERKFTTATRTVVGQVPMFMEGGHVDQQLPRNKRLKNKTLDFIQNAEQVDPLNMIIGFDKNNEPIRGAITVDNYKEVADIYGVKRSKIEQLAMLPVLEAEKIRKRDSATKDIQAEIAERAKLTSDDVLEFERLKEVQDMIANSKSDTVKMTVKKKPDEKMMSVFTEAMKNNSELVIDNDVVNYRVDSVEDGTVKLTANHVTADSVTFGFKYTGEGSLSEQFFKLDDALYERGRDISGDIIDNRISTMDLDKVAFDAMIDGESTPISKRTLLEWLQNDTVMENGRKTIRLGSQLTKEQFTWITNSDAKIRDVNGTAYMAIAQALDNMEETDFIKIFAENDITSKQLAEGISKKSIVDTLSNGIAHTVKVNMLVSTVNPNGEATNALDTAMRVASAYVKNEGKELTADNIADALSHMKNGLGLSNDEMKQYFSTVNDITYEQILEYQRRGPDMGGIGPLTDTADISDLAVKTPEQRQLDNWSKYQARLAEKMGAAEKEAYFGGLSATYDGIHQELKDKVLAEARDKSDSMVASLNKNSMLENRISKVSDKLNNIRAGQFKTHGGSIARDEVGDAMERLFGNVTEQTNLNVSVRRAISDGLIPNESGNAPLIEHILNSTGDTKTISPKRLAEVIIEYTGGELTKEIMKDKETAETVLKMKFDVLQEFYNRKGLNATMDLIKNSGDGNFATGFTNILGDESHAFKTIDEALSSFKVNDLETLEQYTFLSKYIDGLELTGTFNRDGVTETMSFGDYKNPNGRISPIGVTNSGEKIRVVQEADDATMTRSISSFASGQVNVAKKNITKGQYSGGIKTPEGLALMTSTKFSYKNASSRPFGNTAKIDPVTSITNLNKAMTSGATVGTWDFETTGLPDKLHKDIFKPVEFSFTPGKFNEEGVLVKTGDNITKYLAPTEAVMKQFNAAQAMASAGEFDSLFTDKLGRIGAGDSMYGLLHNYAKYDDTTIKVGGVETTAGKLFGSKMRVDDGIVFADIDGDTINTGKTVAEVIGMLRESSMGVVEHLNAPGETAKYGIDASQIFNDEKEFMEFVDTTLRSTDYNAGHNISGFDLPAYAGWMESNKLPASASNLFDNSIDTLTLAQMQNPGRNSNSQEHLTRNLDIPKTGMAHLASYDVEANMALMNDIASSSNIKAMMVDSTEIIKPTDYIYNKADPKIGLQGLGHGVFQVLDFDKNQLTVRNVPEDSIKTVDVPNVATLKKAAADGWINFGDNKELAYSVLEANKRQNTSRTLDNAIANGMWDRYVQFGETGSLDKSKEALNELKKIYNNRVAGVASEMSSGTNTSRLSAPVLQDLEAIAVANASKLTGNGYMREIDMLNSISKDRFDEFERFKNYSQTKEGQMIRDYANAARIRNTVGIYDDATYKEFSSGLSSLISDFKTRAIADGRLSEEAFINMPNTITVGTLNHEAFDSKTYKGSARLKGLREFEFNIDMTSAETIEDSILKASGRLGNHMLNMKSVATKEQGTSIALNSFILPYLSEKGLVSDENLKEAIAKSAKNRGSTMYSDYKNAALTLASDMMSNKETIMDANDTLRVIDKLFAIEDDGLLDELNNEIAELMKATDTSAMMINKYGIDEATGKTVIKDTILPEQALEAVERVVNSVKANEEQHIKNLAMLTGSDVGYNLLPNLNLKPVTSNSDLDEVIRRMAPDAEFMLDADNPWMQWKKAADLKNIATNLDTGVSMADFKNTRRLIIKSMQEGKVGDATKYRNRMPEVFDIIENALGTSMSDKSYIEKLNQDTVANAHANKYINKNRARWNKNLNNQNAILKHLGKRASMIDENAPISGYISDEIINGNRTKYEAMKAIGMLQQDADGRWFTGAVGYGEYMLNPDKVIMTTNVGGNAGKPMSTLSIETLESLAENEYVTKSQKSAIGSFLNNLASADGLSKEFRTNYNRDAEQRAADFLDRRTNVYTDLDEATHSSIEQINERIKAKGKRVANNNAHADTGENIKKIIKESVYDPDFKSITENPAYIALKAQRKQNYETLKQVGRDVFSSYGAKLGAAAIAFAGALALTRQFTSDGGMRNAEGSAIDNQARIVDGDLHKEYNGINRAPINTQKTVRLESEGQGLNISARARNNGSANNVNFDNVIKDSIGSSLSANVNIRHTDDRSTINQEYVQGLFADALR